MTNTPSPATRRPILTVAAFILGLAICRPGIATPGERTAPATPVRVHMQDTILVSGEQQIAVPITLECDSFAASRFEFLIVAEDPDLFSFTGATRGGLLDSLGWEYFSYQTVHDSLYAGRRPDSLIRISAMADLGPIPAQRSQTTLHAGTLLILRLRPTTDLNLWDRCVRIRFLWNSCGDNTFISADGETTFVEQMIWDPLHHAPLWDELDDLHYPDSARPPGLGVADSCLTQSQTPEAERRIIFEQSYLCLAGIIFCESSGDINLNGVCYEIGDAIIFRNYFVFGLSAFESDPNLRAIQIISTDINDDGVTLTLADFFSLVRRVNGDPAWWYRPKPASDPTGASLSWRVNDGSLIVDWDSRADAGGLQLVFDHSDGRFGTPVLSGSAAGMQVLAHDDGHQLRVLIYSFERGAQIVPGAGTILTIPVTDPGKDIGVSHVEAAGYWGNQLDVVATGADSQSRGFTMSQNVPNPFNASTVINFSLQEAGHVTLSVYDILGREVAKLLDGSFPPGIHSITWDARDAHGGQLASGIYFYRLTAPTGQISRKMVLQK